MHFSITFAGALLVAAATASALPQAQQQDWSQGTGAQAAAPAQPVAAGSDSSSGSSGSSGSSSSSSSGSDTGNEGSQVGAQDALAGSGAATTPTDVAPSASCDYTVGYDKRNDFTLRVSGWPEDTQGCYTGLREKVSEQTQYVPFEGWNCNSTAGPTQILFVIGTEFPDIGTRIATAMQQASPGGNLPVQCVYRP